MDVINDGNARLGDASVWVAGSRSSGYDVNECPACSCQTPRWPHAECTTVVVPARSEKEASLDSLGFAARANDILLGAAYALEKGYGISHAVQSCPDELREENIFCFFQPVSKCGDQARNLWMWGGSGVSLQEDKSDITFYDGDWSKVCDALGNPGGDCTSSKLGMWRAIAQLVLQVQPEIELKVQELWLQKFMQSWAAPGEVYAAMHIRRTDKVTGESNGNTLGKPESIPISACSYVDAVRMGFNKRDGGVPMYLNVFVATDDPLVLGELSLCSSAKNWHFHSFFDEPGVGPPGRGMAADVMFRLWGEIKLLTNAYAVAGTYSSNMGRLVQLLRTQPADTFTSVDLEKFELPYEVASLEKVAAGHQEFLSAANMRSTWDPNLRADALMARAAARAQMASRAAATKASSSSAAAKALL